MDMKNATKDARGIAARTHQAALRVLVVGGISPWGLSSSYERAFRRIGCDARIFDHYGHLEGRRTGQNRLLRDVGNAFARRVSARALVACAGAWTPDLVFFVKCDDLPSEVYRGLRQAHPAVRLFAFHPDDPFNCRRFLRQGPSHRRAIEQLRSVDRYFIWSDRLAQMCQAAGARASEYLGFGVDSEFTHPEDVGVGDRKRFGSTVSFIGEWDEKREAWLRPLAESGIGLAIWGSDYWGRRCRSAALRSAWRGKLAEGDTFRKVVVSSLLNVNILKHQNEGAENMRTYEIPACGGVMLAEYSVVQERMFRDGREAFYARSPEELAGRARELLRNPDALAVTGAAALSMSLEHSYEARARKVLAAVMP